MRRSLILMIFIVGCVLITANVFADDGYFSTVLSNIPKSHSAEAMQDLSALKTNLLGCLAAHEGHESSCSNINSFSPSENFTYDFLQAPQDGSKAWSLKASGNSSAGLNADDQIILTSDDNGNISCKGTGQLVGTC
jgi:hypothetical protein